MLAEWGISFHWYGLIIGIAIVVGWWLVQKKADQIGIPDDQLESAFWIAVMSGLIGARVYHVITDWYLYQDQWWTAVYVWRGGLSIIGAVMGGVTGLWLAYRQNIVRIPFSLLLDISVFGVPVGQAIGRLGNWFNQELVGLPTSLPWGIWVEPRLRPVTYQDRAYFHPLFLYEMVATAFFASWVWWWTSRKTNQTPSLGSGFYFALYIAYYCIVRFGLDFLRVDKTMSAVPGLGVNQLIVAVIGLGAVSWLIKQHYGKTTK